MRFIKILILSFIFLPFVNAATINVTNGSLIFTKNNEYKNDDFVLDNGTLVANGKKQNSLGSLTLNSSSTLDFSGGDGRLNFDDSVSVWSGTLSIVNWNNKDRLRIKNIDSLKLSQIIFVNPAQEIGFFSAELKGQDIIPVIPEPSTIFAGFFILLLTLWVKFCKIH